MKKIQWILFSTLLMVAFQIQSQTLRINGYSGELVFIDGHTIPVSGGTPAECQQAFNDAKESYGEELFYGRSGTQECIPNFVYRSPTAPSFEVNPAIKIWPRVPFPPTCLSCPLFDKFDIIKTLYPKNAQLVQGYVKQFKIDQYNQKLKALQDQYKDQLEGFEKKMFALDDHLKDKKQQ